MDTGVFGGMAKYLPGSKALAGAITVADLEATLMAGFTSVRERSMFYCRFPQTNWGSFLSPRGWSLTYLHVIG